MSNRRSDHLFTLIKSLGKAEKRHFKVYSSKHVIGDGNIYVYLFDEIDKQQEYDEQALKNQKLFHDFPSLKKWLYKVILRSLAEYHSSTGMNVRDMIKYIEILFNKSLFDHCLRLIRKAKKIVRVNELLEEWLEVLKWEYKIAVKRSDAREHILEEEKNVFSLLNNQKEYRDAANFFLTKYERYGAERRPRDLQGMKRILSSDLLKNEKRALSFSAKQNFYDCHSLFSIIKGDYRSSYGFSKKIIDLYLAQPEMIFTNSSSYLIRINNFLLSCTGLKKYDEMLVYLGQLEDTRKDLKSPSERATAFFYLYHLLNYYICTGLFKESLDEVKRVEQELSEHERNLNPLQRIILYTVIAQIYFGLENYKRCLSWLNKILSLGEIKNRTDLESYIRLFHLIVLYEAKSDRELMGSLLKSTYRFLGKHERKYKFESAIMNFFRQYVLTGNWRQNMKEPFTMLKKKLEHFAKDPYEKQALNYFDFISWLESKIEGRSFAEMVRKNSNK